MSFTDNVEKSRNVPQSLTSCDIFTEAHASVHVFLPPGFIVIKFEGIAFFLSGVSLEAVSGPTYLH